MQSTPVLRLSIAELQGHSRPCRFPFSALSLSFLFLSSTPFLRCSLFSCLIGVWGSCFLLIPFCDYSAAFIDEHMVDLHRSGESPRSHMRTPVQLAAHPHILLKKTFSGIHPFLVMLPGVS